mmetsp:Transcript_7908/g.16438  ORF Transcript_7908/g.16438 Transcript_7908/m.16438 type:complete len:157 (+) Transcript_7908:288-758(+)
MIVEDMIVIGVLVVDAFCVLYLQTRILYDRGIHHVCSYFFDEYKNIELRTQASRHKEVYEREHQVQKRVHRFMNNMGSCLSEREENGTTSTFKNMTMAMTLCFRPETERDIFSSLTKRGERVVEANMVYNLQARQIIINRRRWRFEKALMKNSYNI